MARGPISGNRLFSPASVALFYAALATVWILVSGALLNLTVDDPAILKWIETGKGLLFVVVSSLVLFSILRAWDRGGVDQASPERPTVGLAWRILAGLVLFCMVPLSGVMIVRMQTLQVERAAFSNLEAIADLKVGQIRKWLDERFNDGDVIMATPGLVGKVAAVQASDSDSSRLLGEVRLDVMAVVGGLRYDTAALLDPHGRPLVEFGGYRAAPEMREMVSEVLVSGLPRFSDLFRDEQGKLQFDLVVPLHRFVNGVREDVGVVVLRDSPERLLFPSLQNWPTSSESGEALLFRRRGNSLIPAMSSAPNMAATSGLFGMDPARAPDLGWSAQGVDQHGAMALAVFRPVAGTDWVLAVKFDRAEVMAPLNDVALWVSTITLLAIALVGAITFMLWRQYSRAHRLEYQAQANRLMQQFYDLPFIGITVMSPETKRWVKFNDRFCEIMGYPREELLGLSWRDITHPDDMALSEVENARVMCGESDGFVLDKRFIRKDGTTVYTNIDVRCVRRGDGSPEYLLTMFHDITERKLAEARIRRLTQTYAALSACNQLIVRCIGEDELFPEICRIAVELGGMKMAWIGMIDVETRNVHPLASYGEGTSWLEGLQSSCDAQSPFGGGQTGIAIRERRPVWVEDFLHAPMTAPWHALGERAGWSSSCALPLQRNGEVVGAFMLYSGERGAFDEEQRGLLSEMAADIGFALTNLAREQARRLAESQLDRLAHMYAALSECNQAIVRCTSEGELFPQICRFAVQYGGMKMAWVGRVDVDARCVMPVASYGEGAEHLQGVTISIDDTSPYGLGAMGAAIRERRLAVVQDYLGDPRTAPWRERAVEAGWGGAAAVPLSCGGEVVGGLALLAGETNAFDEQICRLLAEMALDISFALDLFAREKERRSIEEQLRLSAKVFEQGGEGIMITDDQANIVTVNRAFEVITGYAQEEVIGRNPRFLSSDRHDRDFFRAMWEGINTGGFWQGEIWNRRKDGDVYPEFLSVSRVVDGQGKVTNYVGTFNDVSESKASQEHIQRLAHYDSLTGLPNRILLADRVNLALSRMERNGEQLALIFLDLDRFKNVNDSLGHRVGDELLIQVAQRLKELLREEDTVSRLGGDEFILVLPASDEDGAGHVAGKVLKALSAPYYIEQYELAVTASMGIAMYPDDGATYEALSMCADTAMYRAKQSGRQTFRFFTREMQERSDRTLLLENALRRALELNQLHLHFQPQVSLENGRVIGVEALLRWTHPELGEVAPVDFIPVAEDSGMILPIGEWVLRSAVRQMREWLDRGMPPSVMAVNLSAIQFRQANLPQFVSQVLDEAGLPPGLLELELTEGVAMENPLEAIAVMNDLHGRGIRMSIDDFGTGYSSLSYLKRFKVYKLKIDKSFVRDISRDPEDEAIVEAIIGLAESLGMQTIAEGVETDEQSAFLRAKGCNEGQGFLYGRPMPADAFEEFARQSAVALGDGR